jgi:prepilin-type N-terminal cleavage/methylation domain-containing protein
MAVYARERGGAQHGFTLVEVLAAIAILLIGVLGVAALATGANKTTGRTKSHEAAAGLAREMLESSRAMPYADLTAASLSSMLRQRHPDSDAATPGWQVKRRGITYTATSSLCTLDDPKDGMGAHDASFCSDTGGAGTVDANPNDYKRAMVTLAWNGTYGSQTTAQSTLITNSDRGPAVTTLATVPPGSAAITSGNSVNFGLTTSVAPSEIEWYLDGAFQEDLGKGISGSGTSYSFSWKIGSACTNNSATDGSYVVSAQAFNSAGSTPGPRALTVRLNRCAPYAPTGVVGGRNRWGVELSWEANKEDDVIGYRVFRGIGGATPTAIASGPCSGVVKTNGCIEPDPASTQALVYNVRAVDLDSSGSQRNGASSSNVSVTTGNRAPGTPAVTSNGTASTLRWPAVSDPDGGDSVDYYRIYRDGQTLAHRYDVVDAVTNPLLWTDADAGGSTHTYYVVAVDTRSAESGFSTAVTR